MVLNQEDKFTNLTGEILLFGLLGKLLYAELDKSWLQQLIDEDVFAETPFGAENTDIICGLELLQTWAQKNINGISDESFKDLLADSTRLFDGGKVFAAPWESVYFGDDRLIFQERTVEVRSWYKRFGLEAEKIYREPDDHIGLELLFLSHLATLGIQALNEQDHARFDELLEAQRAFIKEHLGTWVETWCSLVEQYAKTDFYKGFGILTRGAVSALAEMLDAKLAKDSVR
jgi:TorA maturation chaperone TorD